jgi:hypothetical protein
MNHGTQNLAPDRVRPSFPSARTISLELPLIASLSSPWDVDYHGLRDIKIDYDLFSPLLLCSSPTAPISITMTTPITAGASTPSASAPSRRVPLDKRKRTETSCDKCKSRKQKCRKEAGQDSCRYCILHNFDCLTTQPRKRRLYGSVESLGNRLALLESLVKGLLPEADLSNLDEMRRLGISLGIPLPDSANGDAPGEAQSGSGTEGEEPMSLLPDQQGQVQYTGPSSSFSFHLKLRSLCGQSAIREFVLFGKNPADPRPTENENNDGHPLTFSTPGAASNIDPKLSRDQHVVVSNSPTYESLIGAYFDHINPDFPVLHESSFREAYNEVTDFSKADPAWLCSFLCVLLLARRVMRVAFTEGTENEWWRRVQTLLPVVIFTSSVTAVQVSCTARAHYLLN